MKSSTFKVVDFLQIKKQLLAWANRADSCFFLDNHGYNPGWNQQGCLLAIRGNTLLEHSGDGALDSLQTFIDVNKGKWIFGHLSYDLKNNIENDINSAHPDFIEFPDLHFFVPVIVVWLFPNTICIEDENGFPELVLEKILAEKIEAEPSATTILPEQGITKQAYINIIKELRNHILRGDCYEINFCQSFFSKNAVIDPLAVYKALVKISPNPFACFYKMDDKYLLCASPERYITKNGNRILSQPIKGTAPRIINNEAKDEAQKTFLQNNSKEKSENVMVVDIVRNDLSKICQEASVQVDELFGIYTYPQVHQMISSISGVLQDGVTFIDILKATFPMGSMTGAPKLKVMKLIEEYEQTKRGLFSGSIGYISPDGDFDFNVVIRSILYNREKQHISYQVGSGITFYSNPENEYEECMVKAQAIIEVLNGKKI